MKEITFLALEPPGNIAKPYYALQEKLFRSLGMTTARLFPPIIPVRCISGREIMQRGGGVNSTAAENFADVHWRLEQTDRMKCSGNIRFDKRTIFLTVEAVAPSGKPEGTGTAGDSPAPLFEDYVPENFLFPEKPGILLCFTEAAAGSKALPSAIGPPADQSWKATYLAEIHFRYSGTPPNFETAQWEYKRYEKAVCRGSA